MTLNTNTLLRQIRADNTRHRQQALSATCPHCQADILDQLEYAAHENSLESTTTIGCPNCKAEITFELEWTIEIYKATIQDTKLFQAIRTRLIRASVSESVLSA